MITKTITPGWAARYAANARKREEWAAYEAEYRRERACERHVDQMVREIERERRQAEREEYAREWEERGRLLALQEAMEDAADDPLYLPDDADAPPLPRPADWYERMLPPRILRRVYAWRQSAQRMDVAL